MKIPENKLDLIIEILHQHDKRFEQMEANRQSDKQEILQRFEQVDKRFEQVEEKLQNLKQEVRDVKHDVRSDRDKLQEVYESRNKVAVSFTKSWAIASFFIAMISSTIVIAFSKAFG